MKKMIKALVIFGAGMYTGVYVAQNYKNLGYFISQVVAAALYGLGFLIDKVEDPMVLFEKAQTYVKSKLAEFNDNSKKGDK